MSSKKKLQQAAIKFRKQSPALLYAKYQILLSAMARFITKSGAAEVTVGIKNGELYYEAN